MKRSPSEWTLWATFHIFIWIGVALAFAIVATIAITLLACFGSPAEANETLLDEPMIVTENQGITTGVYDGKAVNLHRFNGPRGGQTFGTVGDQVILIDHFPARRGEHHESKDLSIRPNSSYRWGTSEEMPYLQPEEK